MAWSISTKQIAKESDVARIRIMFEITNGIDVVSVTRYATSVPDMDRIAKEELTRVSALFDFADAIEPGPIEIKPDTPPTQEEIDRAAFIVLISKYKALLAAVKAGVIQANDLKVTKAETDMKSAYKAGFENLLIGF